MQSNTTCPLIEQYLSYLVVIKGRAENTFKEYRTDLLMFFRFVLKARNIPLDGQDFSVIDINLINSISLHECLRLTKLPLARKITALITLKE